MSFDDVIKDFRNWLVLVTGINDQFVFFAQQDAPKAGTDFLTLNATSDQATDGISDQMQINDDGTQTLIESREAAISLNFYGANADANAKAVRNSIDLPKSIQRFSNKLDGKQPYVVVSKDRKFIKNATFLETGQWLQRRMIELFIGYTDTFTTALSDVGEIDNIQVEGEWDEDSSNFDTYKTVDLSLDITATEQN
jgi:hypothetical protein